jgi:hypothetical protein
MKVKSKCKSKSNFKNSHLQPLKITSSRANLCAVLSMNSLIKVIPDLIRYTEFTFWRVEKNAGSSPA